MLKTPAEPRERRPPALSGRTDRPRPADRSRPAAARRVVGGTLAKSWRDRLLGLSAEAAFWQLLSLPPLILALLGSLGYIGGALGADTVDVVEARILRVTGQVATPAVVENVIQPTLQQVLHRGRADVISVGFLVSLWAGSSATATFVNTITIAYDMRDLRGAIRSRLLALWIYVVSLAVLAIVLPLLVVGPTALRHAAPLSWRPVTDQLIRSGYWPITGGLLLLGLAALYHYATPVRLRWRRALPGAAVAVGLFVLGGYALRLYVSLVVGRALPYGALGAPVAALLFFYILAVAVLLGAEVNATLERLWPRGAQQRRIERVRALRNRVGQGVSTPLPRRTPPS